MSVETVLLRKAKEIAAQAEHRLREIKTALDEIEKDKAKIQANRQLALGAAKRLFHFRTQIGGDYQCPRCWIDNEARSTLAPIGNPGEDADVFRCRNPQCRFEISIPFE